MGHIRFKNHKTARGAACSKPAAVKAMVAALAIDRPAFAGPVVAGVAGAAPAVAGAAVVVPAARQGAGLDVTIRKLATTGAGKARGLLRLYVHSREVRAAAQALAQALAESREVWSWPGDRLPVGAEMSQQVERLTRRLKLETEAHNRLEALFRTSDGGRSVVAV